MVMTTDTSLRRPFLDRTFESGGRRARAVADHVERRREGGVVAWEK